MIRLWWLVFIFGLAPSCVADVRIVDTTAYYHGEINEKQNRKLFGKVANSVINRLIITSSGGEVVAGIELGKWIHDRGIDVEVVDYCLSSCANYVFTAGRKKTINDGAIVAWHGNYHHLQATGLWRDDIESRMNRTGESREVASQKLFEQVEYLVKLEQEFFSAIGVDQYLCWVGKMPPYEAPNYFFMNATDMARYGVNQVQSPANYPHTDLSGFEQHILFISPGEDDG